MKNCAHGGTVLWCFMIVSNVLQVLRFYGNLHVRVVAGVIKLESYALKCSAHYLPLTVPFHRSSTAMSMEAMDPDTRVRPLAQPH